MCEHLNRTGTFLQELSRLNLSPESPLLQKIRIANLDCQLIRFKRRFSNTTEKNANGGDDGNGNTNSA